MKNSELTTFETTGYLSEGDPIILKKIRPFFSDMIFKLISLPEDATEAQKLKIFEECIKRINRFENSIETVERETILSVLYEIGSIVGLDHSSNFAEHWRGDW